MSDDARFDLRALLAECREYVEQCEPGNTIKGRNHVTEFLARLDAALAGSARAEVERLREDVATFSDDFRRVTSETCAPDELHCSCVPHLRAAVEAARAEAVTMRTWAEEAAKAENENAEDLEVTRYERDEARRMLAECAILTGTDTDGNTLESGWVHLWRRAVDDVSQLRADYDDHSDIERAERERDEAQAEVSLLQHEARIRRHISDGLAAEVAAERVAVVAFLRETLATSETAYASDDLDYAIDIIERGEHRREEKT